MFIPNYTIVGYLKVGSLQNKVTNILNKGELVMPTIYFTRRNSDVEEFYASDIEQPIEEVIKLNTEDDNFIDGEQMCFFGYTNKNQSEHEFYGFDSREQMLDAVL